MIKLGRSLMKRHKTLEYGDKRFLPGSNDSKLWAKIPWHTWMCLSQQCASAQPFGTTDRTATTNYLLNCRYSIHYFFHFKHLSIILYFAAQQCCAKICLGKCFTSHLTYSLMTFQNNWDRLLINYCIIQSIINYVLYQTG